MIKGEHFFSDKPWLCNLIASMCLTACFCAFASLTMLSLNRYVYLCHNEIYDKMYGRITCIVICVMCWIAAFLCEFPNFIGWGGHYFDQEANQCIWDRTSSLSYTLFVAIGLIGFPLLTMTICFILIFRRIWNTKKALYDIDEGKDGRMGKVMVESFRAAKTIFVIFVVFVICWTPYAVVIAIDVENTLPMPVHLFLTLLAHLHSSCNFIIYFVGNKRFRVVLGRILGCHDKTAILSETKSSSVPDSPGTTRYNNFSGIIPQLKITKKQTSTGSDSYDGHIWFDILSRGYNFGFFFSFHALIMLKYFVKVLCINLNSVEDTEIFIKRGVWHWLPQSCFNVSLNNQPNSHKRWVWDLLRAL